MLLAGIVAGLIGDESHEIPETTTMDCGMMQQATPRTMPKGVAPVGWTPASTHPFYRHVDFLRRHCIGG